VLTTFLCIAMLHSAAQEYDQHRSYLNRKTIAVGYTQIGIAASALNGLLADAGYPSIPSSVGAISLHAGSDFGPRWGAYYGADLGTIESRESGSKSLHFRYDRFYAGVEYTIIRQHEFELLSRLAFSYSIAQVRLYDTVSDTISFARYLSGKDDAKRVETEGAGIDIGFQSRFRIPKSSIISFIGIRAGYIFAIGGNSWSHDAVRFEEAPYTWLGSWYAGVHIGGLYHRRITRIPAEEFKPR
jgi:hypothetical protein